MAKSTKSCSLEVKCRNMKVKKGCDSKVQKLVHSLNGNGTESVVEGTMELNPTL